VEAGRWTLELSILEVESARVTGQLILALAGSDLTPARIDATAEDVVTRLLPDELDPTRPDAAGPLGEPPPPPSSEIDPGVEPEPAPPVEERHRRLVWGYQRPTPRWKWAGFGASAGLSVVGIAVVVGTAVYLQRGFREDLEAAASATLDKPEFNQVPLTLPAYVSLCDYNRYHYDVVSNTYIRGAQSIGSNGVPGARDQGVAEVCTRGENVKTTNTAALVVTGVSLVSTAVFTTLLFVHRAAREPSRATARAWSRRGLRVDLSPAVGRGATLGVHGRF
ncbi:MAG: hypothetical protein KDK70_29350, partial [Myxococcales bacterium]|nr:hypothetical protein [Myxococcales bacterium]